MKIKLLLLVALLASVNIYIYKNQDTEPHSLSAAAHRLSRVFDQPIGTYTAILPDTGSMEPCLSVGDLAYINELFPYDELKRGDIIVYAPKELEELFESGLIEFKALIHRIEGISGLDNGVKHYYIRGDNNPARDRFRLTPENYRGKVFRIELDYFTKEEVESMFKIKADAVKKIKEAKKGVDNQ